MTFVNLIFSAWSLKKLETTLKEEKLDAIKAHEDKSYKKKFKLRHLEVDIREAIKQIFLRLFKCSETSRGYRTCYKLGHEGSCENFALKSALGFVGGVFLTYFLYIFFIFQLSVKLTSATVVCSILGCVLTVGLAFSSKVRCVVLLTLPQFFSKRGRQALLAYAFVLALTGPAQNTLNNMGILSDSLACGQEQLKQAVKQIIDVIKRPFVAIKEAIKKVVKTIKEVVKKIKEILLKIKRMVMALVRVIKSVFEFLGKMINICNKELGTPFERCTRVFENAIADCNAKLGPLFSWLCSLTYIVKAVCYIVKVFDYVCMLVDFISNSVVGVIIRKIKIFVRHIKTMFYVRIKFGHSFEYKTITSKSMAEVQKEILAEIEERSRKVVAFFKFMTSASMLFFMYLVFQVAYYRIKYLTSERYDNIYITQYFRDIDQRRAKVGKETVLPLTKKERVTYVPISGSKLGKKERRNLSKAATTLATASVKLGTHMAVDYSLYWILTIITHHARYQSKVQAPNLPVAHVSGEGFLATLLRAIVNAFQPVGIKMEIDTIPCLPKPIPPNFDRYVQIVITILICWILTVLEPYGLRFRNYIMGYYYPLRAKQRTIWLYNHILRSRTSFLLLARRSLRKKFGMKGRQDEISCKEWLRSKLRCGIFRICLGSDLQITCLLCGEVFREKDKTRFVKCHTPGCPGLFCLECFADLKNICPICLSPIEYGDLDDLDEEQDSSGDEPPAPKKPRRKLKCPWLPCGKVNDDNGDIDGEKSLIPKDEEVVEQEEKNESEHQAVEESDSSTDYSFSYQYDDYTKQEPLPEPSIWKDVEMQSMPDEASMETFREGDDDDEHLHVEFDNQIKVPKDHAARVRMDVSAVLNDDDESDDSYGGDSQPLLDKCTCSMASPRRVEFIGVPDTMTDIHKDVRRKTSSCICFDDGHDLPKSTMSTSTRSDCKYCKCPNIDIQSSYEAGSETENELMSMIPKLDLSFLKKDDKFCTCDSNPVLSSRFSNVKYKEESETPPRSPSDRSLESSSILTSLQHPLLRKRHIETFPGESPSTSNSNKSPPVRNVKTQHHLPEVSSATSMDIFEFNRGQNRKVKRYYQATRSTCADQSRQYGRQRRSITDMLKRILPRQYHRQGYLPLYQRDIDQDRVRIQSYNYNRQDWDTLSVDTNSPTYPFATQISSDTSEEDHLLGRRRIRGGECTHLISCRLIGRECPQKSRSVDAKSELILGRTKLKDFSTLSLPPKPKPANSKEQFFNLLPKGGKLHEEKIIHKSMNLNENPRVGQKRNLADRVDSSDYIIPKNTASVLPLACGDTPPSSDSGLSETTCAALFGGPCPKGFGKSATVESIENQEQERYDTEEEVEKEQRNILASEIIDEHIQNVNVEALSDKTSDHLELQRSRTSAIAASEQRTSITEEEKKSTTASINSKHSDEKAISSVAGSRQSISEPASILGEAQPSTSQTERSSNRGSTQLNQLLYKDEKTEISLVQKLSPGKPVLKKSPTPPVKLKISLHNSIIPEEELNQPNPEPTEMFSPQSQDKIVETQDIFPKEKNSKLILSRDKTQQTSDNDIYRSARADFIYKPAPSSSAAPRATSSSDPRFTSSGAYYSSDLPEKDSNCKNNCKCSICRLFQVHQLATADRSGNCGCCKCVNPSINQPPPQSRQYYQPPQTFYNVDPYYETELPEYLPPPTPSPPPPPPRRYVPPQRRLSSPYRRCSEQCDCCSRQPYRRMPSQNYDPRFNIPSYNDDYDEYSNPNLSDLPYQNNEDYLELVEELQDTLHTRNRNRVKRAMQEFEKRSKHNKPLEKPIIDYDESSESEEPIMRKIDQLRTERKRCCAGDKCLCGKGQGRGNYSRSSKPTRERMVVEERPSHWTMDPGSGEWHKASELRSPKGGSRDSTGFEHCICNCDHRCQ